MKKYTLIFFLFLLIDFESIGQLAIVTLPYNQSFVSDLGDCYPYSVTGSTNWYWNEENNFYLNATGPWNQFAEVTGYGSGQAQENWLILPGFVKSSGDEVVIDFSSYFNYGEEIGGTLELFYSTDYSGSGTPAVATWTNLSFVLPIQKKKWYYSELVALPDDLSGTVYVAFKYISPDINDKDIRTWRVDDISIVNSNVLPQPDNYPTIFTATAQSASNILTTWEDATGTNLPTGYLILASDEDGVFNHDPPSDGNSYAVDKDLSDGRGNVNIFHGGYESTQWTALNATTTYYFKIYPYSNTGDLINYKTDGAPPVAAATTSSGSTLPSGTVLITEFMAEPGEVSDGDGEWFELYNSSGADINLNGWLLESTSSGGLEQYSIVSKTGQVMIKADSFLVFGLNGDVLANGGVPVGYEYEDIFMDNEYDTLRLVTDAGNIMDFIEWGGPDGVWDIQEGKSLKFNGKVLGDNNDGLNWLPSLRRENGYVNSVYSGDFGSPGTNGLFQNLISETTWTGTGLWSEGNLVGRTNWSNGAPGKHVDVHINGQVTVDLTAASPAKCAKLTFGSGTDQLIIPPNKVITTK